MTQKRKNSLPTGEEGRKALSTREKGKSKREEDIITSLEAANDAEVDMCRGDIMDKAVIAMVNLYLKSLSSSERYIVLKNIVRPSAESEQGIKAHIDGAKLADLIDMAKAYLAELLNVRNIPTISAGQTPCGRRPEEPEEAAETVFDTVIGVDMSNTNCGMINTVEYEDYSDGTELVDGAELAEDTDNVDTETDGAEAADSAAELEDDVDDGFPKYNPELEMSFEVLLNKSWEVLYNLMKNLSGTEYVTHMPFELAEMIANHYEEITDNSRQSGRN